MAIEKKAGWMTIVSGVIIVIILMFIHNAMDKQVNRQGVSYLTIGVQNNPITSLIIIAQEEGFFKKEGLNVKLVRYPSGKLALQALLAYHVDMAASSDIPILIHAFAHTNFSVLATINESESRAEMVVRKGRGISNPSDLVDKSIATQKNSGVDYYTYLFLKHYNIPISSVHMVYLPAVKLVMALRSGYVDAFVMRSPYTEEASHYMPGQILFFHVPDLYLVRFNLVATKVGVKYHREEVEKVLQALQYALNFVQQNPLKAQNDVIKFFGLMRRDEVMSLWPHYQFTLSLTPDMVASMKKQSQWIIDSGRGLKKDEPDFSKLIDDGPLNAVLKGTLPGHLPVVNPVAPK